MVLQPVSTGLIMSSRKMVVHDLVRDLRNKLRQV